jgi:hypothetical protein
MTADERTMWTKAADDSRAVQSLLYSLLKFVVDIRIPPDGMKGIQEAIKAIDSFEDSVRRDLEDDAKPKH